MTSLVAALLLLAPPPVPVFEVLAADQSTPIGTAFLVLAGDGLEGIAEDSLLLVSAAHVFASPGPDGLWIRAVDCESEVKGDSQPRRYKAKIWNTAKVLVWPGMDLAAIPFGDKGVEHPSDEPLKEFQDRAARLEWPSEKPSGWTPEVYTKLVVFGFHAASVCGMNPAFYYASPTWKQEVDGLIARMPSTQRPFRDQHRLRFSGSMDDATQLIQYWSPAGPGASGGPVWFHDPALQVSHDGRFRVVGVHVGGTKAQGAGWAVVPGSLALRAATAALDGPLPDWPDCLKSGRTGADEAGDRSGLRPWPCYSPPTYRHSLDRAPPGIRHMADRSATGIFALGLSLGSDVGAAWGAWRSASSVPGDWPAAKNWTARLGIGADYWLSSGHALGGRVVAGYRWSDYAQVLKSPSGTELERRTVREEALVAEIWPVEYSFGRSSRLWPTIGIGGRAIIRDRSNVAWAVPVHLKLSPTTQSERFAFTIDLMASLEWDPDLTKRYTLAGDLQTGSVTWGLSFGMAVGFDLVLNGAGDES